MRCYCDRVVGSVIGNVLAKPQWIHTEPGMVTYDQHADERNSSTEHSRAPTNPLVSPTTVTGRYVMTRTDFGGSQFPDDEDIQGSRNVGLLAIETHYAAARPRICY